MVVFGGKWGDEIGGGKWYEGGFIFPVVFWDGVRIDPVIFGFFLGVKKGCFCSDKVSVCMSENLFGFCALNLAQIIKCNRYEIYSCKIGVEGIFFA